MISFYDLVVVKLLVSGGVDSTVCAALLHKALREDQVIAVHIDNGFMRKNESQRVEQSLEKLGLRLRGSVLVAMIVFFYMKERVQNSLQKLTCICYIEEAIRVHFKLISWKSSSAYCLGWYYINKSNVIRIMRACFKKISLLCF